MLQIIYITAFTVLSLFAVTNLIRSMIAIAQNESPTQSRSYTNAQRPRPHQNAMISKKFIHPELLDENGNLTDEPLLVMRSFSFDDARSRLDALYESSPSIES